MTNRNPTGQHKKVAVSAFGPGLEARPDIRFGRAAGFVIVDPTDDTVAFVANAGAESLGQGAGIAAAEAMARADVGVVLTGSVGPKAAAALAAAGIKVVETCEGRTVGDVVRGYRADPIPQAAP